MTEQPGVHSESGKLRTVLVHRPDLALRRLTPANCHELLFDDVLWVRRAGEEHDGFVRIMRERGVEVLQFGELLAQTLASAKAKTWLLDRRIAPEKVGVTMAKAFSQMPCANASRSKPACPTRGTASSGSMEKSWASIASESARRATK